MIDSPAALRQSDSPVSPWWVAGGKKLLPGLVNPYFRSCSIFAALAVLVSCGAPTQAESGFNQRKLDQIGRVIETAIEEGKLPGAVLWIESKGEVYCQAYGHRSIWPSYEPMTVDTVFDVASLTKVLATTPAILHLVDQEKLDLDAPVSLYLPEFLEGGVRPEPKDETLVPEDRERVTVRDLLTHQSGLPPGIFLSERDFWGHEAGVRRALTIGLLDKPKTVFRYSDVNFILLGEIVRRVSGMRIDRFVDEVFFSPMRLGQSGFVPTSQLHRRIAPTTKIEGYGLIRGQVHDPTARRMQGVAGHAGLFATVEEVAALTRLMLNRGRVGELQLLSEAAVEEATQNQLPETFEISRGLGWDISSPYAYQRGERFPREGFGHTGWTGTSVWVDPASETFVILLANRNHPAEGTSIKPLRIEVGTLAGEAVGYTRAVPLAEREEEETEDSFHAVAAGGDGAVLNGIDVLERDGFSALAGLRVGLVTNQTGINRQRRSTADLLAESPEVNLVALFSPEHGIRGVLEQDSVDDGRDLGTGLPIFSLYKSDSRKPTEAQLEGLDALVFDIQDIGCRFYTYVSTMGLAMEAAGEAGKKFIVLDRVNPIGGEVVDGPIRSGRGNDFVAFHDIPVQHGMTVGELAKMFREERGIEIDLQVIPVEGWHPSLRFDDTGLPWINPSPNIRSATQATLYPGVGLIEFTNVSVGRGTLTPFEHVGAPYIHEGRLAQRLREEDLPGIIFLPTRFTPDASVYEGEDCGGVRFVISDRDQLRPLDLGLALMRSLYDLHPGTFSLEEKGDVLLRHQPTLEAVLDGKSIEAVREGWQPELDHFLKRREAFLLYPRD
ncbi:MAG: exo-beta-N-acetylmuramidase NamZ domain-containing protein [Verrucomicrobiota bacterium]